MQRDPFRTPDPWQGQDPARSRDPWKAKDPFGVDLDAERRRTQKAREDRQAQEARVRQVGQEQRGAEVRDEQREQMRAKQNREALDAQDAAMMAEQQAEAKRRYLAGPTLDGRHEREKIEDKADRAANAAEAIRQKWAQERDRDREKGRTG